MVIDQSKRNFASKVFNAWNEKDKIAGWRLELDRILQIFKVRLILSTWPLLIISFVD